MDFTGFFLKGTEIWTFQTFENFCSAWTKCLAKGIKENSTHCGLVRPYDIGGLGPDDTKPHDDVIKWKNFLRYWPFVRGIHRSPLNSPQKGQWRGALMFSLICVWINGWENNREAGDLRRYRAHYGVIVMISWIDAYLPSKWFSGIYTRALEY